VPIDRHFRPVAMDRLLISNFFKYSSTIVLYPIHTLSLDDDVFQNLQAVKLSFSSAPDLVPSCVIKKCADALCKLLSKLFQISLLLSYFPEVWKEAFIIPLHKKGSKSDIKNYRGIAKLSVIPKFFEQLITAKLQHQCSSVMSPTQHGFMKRRPCLQIFCNLFQSSETLLKIIIKLMLFLQTSVRLSIP